MLDLWSGTWQTDRRTDRQRPSMHYAAPYGGGASQVFAERQDERQIKDIRGPIRPPYEAFTVISKIRPFIGQCMLNFWSQLCEASWLWLTSKWHPLKKLNKRQLFITECLWYIGPERTNRRTAIWLLSVQSLRTWHLIGITLLPSF